MKILFALISLCMSAHTFACLNKISPVDANRVIASQSYAAAETLTYSGEDALCVDGINLLEVDLIDGELIPNPDKKFARELAEKNAADAEKAQEAKCKSFSFKGKTIAELKAELNESMGCRK